jgi:tetratricopeptide (TPR) repeat protein
MGGRAMARWAALLGLFSICASSGQDAPLSPADEYKTRLARINEALADEHFKVGEYLAGVSMFRWAREEYRKAIGFSMDHEESRKRLGYVKKEGDWAPDPDASLESENKKKGDEQDKVKKEYDTRIDRLGKNVGRMWAELGGFCEKNKMTAEAQAAWKKAIEYDPMNGDSRRKLGYARQGKSGPWLSKFESAFRKQAKEGIAKSPGGAGDKTRTTVESDMGWTHEKRKSPHFLIEAAKDQEWLAKHVKHGEHAYALFHKLFDVKDELFQQPYNIVIVKDKAQHEAYVDKYHQGDSTRREFSKKMKGTGGFPQTEVTLGNDPDLHEFVVHMTTQRCSEHLTGGSRPWLHEGLAYHFSMQVIGKGGTFCTNIQGTGAGGGERDYRNMEDWPLIMRTLINESKDPAMIEVFKCKDFAELSGAEAVKAWSLVDFLVTEHRERFLDFCSKARGQREDEDEKILKEVFDWTIDDLDTRWRTYVRAFY